MQKRLTKSQNKILAGVFGGVANYFNFDPAWVRIIGAALILFTGVLPGIALYIIAAMVMPEPNEVAPKTERHETDYQTGRPNTMNGNFTKSDDHADNDDHDEKDKKSDNNQNSEN